MKKIISLFQRNYDTDHLVRNEVVPGAEWVIAGEGVPTRKWDGTCCMVRDGRLYKRFELKAGRVAPPEFEPAQEPDPVTGDVPGWVPVGDGSEDRWHREAFDSMVVFGEVGNAGIVSFDGTYELCGPKVNGNPEGFPIHVLVKHGIHILPDALRDLDGLKAYFAAHDIEGIVWHHPDGRMVKIKGKDFGIKRGVK